MATPEEEELKQLQSEKLKIEQQYQSMLSQLTGKYKDVLDEQQSLAEQSKSLRVMQRSLTNALMAEMAQLRQYVNGEGRQRPLRARTIAGIQQELIRQERAYIESIKRLTGVVEDRIAAEQEAYSINAKIDAERVAESKQKYLQILDRSTKQLERSLGIGSVFSTVGDALRDINDMDTKGQKSAVALAALAGALNDFRETLEKTQKQIGTTLGTAFDQVIGAQVNAVKSIFIPGARVSAQDIIDATTAFTNEFGTILSPDAARGIAQEAKALGVSADIFVKARRQFLTVGEVTRIQSLYTSTFVNAGLRQAQAFEFAAQNASLVAIAGDKYAVSLAKAAANATKIGVSLDKTTNFFDNILDNFEGALETASELRALGIKIDFSDMARIAATGTPEEQQAALANLFRENRVALDNLQRQGFLRRQIETSFPQFDMDEIIRMAKGESAIRPQEETVKERPEQELQGVVAKSIDAMLGLTGAIVAIMGNYVLSSREVYRNTLATRANTAAFSSMTTGGGGGGVLPGGGGGAGGRARGVSGRVLGGVGIAGMAAGMIAPFVMASAQRDIEKAKEDETKRNAAILKASLGGALEGFSIASIVPMLALATGTVMSGGALAAILGGGALVGGLVRGFGASRQFDDFTSNPITGRYLVTPEGVHPINPRDTIIGGTNLEAGLSGATNLQYGQTNSFPIGSLRAPLNDFVDPPVRPMTGRTGTSISVETAAIAALYGIDMRAQADQLPRTPQKPTLPRQNIPTIGPRTGVRVPEQTALQKTADYALTTAEFTPVIGDAMQLARTAKAFYDRDYGRGAMEAGFFALGLLPFGELARGRTILKGFHGSPFPEITKFSNEMQFAGEGAAIRGPGTYITTIEKEAEREYARSRGMHFLDNILIPSEDRIRENPQMFTNILQRYSLVEREAANQAGSAMEWARVNSANLRDRDNEAERLVQGIDRIKAARRASDGYLQEHMDRVQMFSNALPTNRQGLYQRPGMFSSRSSKIAYDANMQVLNEETRRLQLQIHAAERLRHAQEFLETGRVKRNVGTLYDVEMNLDLERRLDLPLPMLQQTPTTLNFLKNSQNPFIRDYVQSTSLQNNTGQQFIDELVKQFGAGGSREALQESGLEFARHWNPYQKGMQQSGIPHFDAGGAPFRQHYIVYNPDLLNITKVRDIMMDPAANRYITGPEGTFQLDSKDAVVAGTNLFDAGNVMEPRDPDTVPMDIQGPNVNTSNLESTLDQLYTALSSMRIDLDANTVGRKSYDARSPLDRLSVVG